MCFNRLKNAFKHIRDIRYLFGDVSLVRLESESPEALGKFRGVAWFPDALFLFSSIFPTLGVLPSLISFRTTPEKYVSMCLHV